MAVPDSAQRGPLGPLQTGCSRPGQLHRRGRVLAFGPRRRTARAHCPNALERTADAESTVEETTFITGVRTITTGGDVGTRTGFACSIYSITSSMVDACFYNGDAEMLFVLEHGDARFCTEFGIINAEPSEIVVIPRGVKLRVEVPDGPARGYLCENYGGSFTLPERGPIGANCLANPRDFLTPVAAYEDREVASTLYVKWGGVLWQTELGHSPLDVVAWHGNYAPYKYDMRRFSPVGPLLFDHADPSIFTVLTSPSETPGTANIDFVVFP